MIASTRIDLIVRRSDEQVVGAPGACWDPLRQTWFIDAGVDLHLFLDWLPEDERLAATSRDDSPDSDSAKGVTLSAFLGTVRQVISEGLPEAVWVRAEIRKV